MFKGEFKVGGIPAVVEGDCGLFDFLVYDVEVIEEDRF